MHCADGRMTTCWDEIGKKQKDQELLCNSRAVLHIRQDREQAEGSGITVQ